MVETQVGTGVMMKLFLLSGLLVAMLFVVSSCSSTNEQGSNSSKTTSTEIVGEGELSTNEKLLTSMLPEGNQTCLPVRVEEKDKKWPIAIATLDCESQGTSSLSYGLFNNATELDDTYLSQAQYMRDEVQKTGGKVYETVPGEAPCAKNPNESGEWGVAVGKGKGGKFTCVSVPNPRIVWTDRNSLVIGDASRTAQDKTSELISWWTTKAGPK